jgi:isochorismate pyruvate lyase
MPAARRQSVSSGSPFEAKLGICRAVRVGPIIAVSGTAPLDAQGRTVAPGDAAAQARRCLEIIDAALRGLGASPADVVGSITVTRSSVGLTA